MSFFHTVLVILSPLTDWSCTSATNENIIINGSLTSLRTGACPLCLMNLEINTTSLYFWFCSSTLSASTDFQEVFTPSSLSLCWLLYSRGQMEMKVSPAWMGEFLCSLGWFTFEGNPWKSFQLWCCHLHCRCLPLFKRIQAGNISESKAQLGFWTHMGTENLWLSV